jgi:hypothetical protein
LSIGARLSTHGTHHRLDRQQIRKQEQASESRKRVCVDFLGDFGGLKVLGFRMKLTIAWFGKRYRKQEQASESRKRVCVGFLGDLGVLGG